MRDLDVALEAAAEFVEAHGDALDRARIDAIARGGARAEAVAGLAALQSAEGCFAPLRRSAGPGVVGTLEALGALDGLRALDTPAVERAVAWLGGQQRGDGSWRHAGDPERAVTTGMLGGYLAKTRFARPETLEGAGAFLARHWSPERLRGAWSAIAAFAHFFSNAPHELSDAALQWCGRELERGLRSGRCDALSSARVFTLCDAHALPGTRIGRDELVAGVLAEQGEDGGWTAQGAADPAAAGARVEATLDASLALARLRRRA